MNKRVNYMQLLKESVADQGHDTSKSVDVKGPFLDPILSYDGGGELQTHKDAASILERYYFKTNSDKGVRVNEDEEIPQVGEDKAALPDVPEDVNSSKDDIEDAVSMDSTDEVENAVIERLIAEMEGDGGEIGGPEPDQDPAAEFHDPAGDPDENWEELIDGDAHDKEPPAAKLEEKRRFNLSLFDLLEDEDIVAGGDDTPDDDKKDEDKDEDDKKDDDKDEDDKKDDKDLAEFFIREDEDADKDDSDKDEDDSDKEDDDSDLDVDEEVKKESLGPLKNPKNADERELEESFKIFKEAFDDGDDDEDDKDSKDDEDDDKDKDEDKDADDDVKDFEKKDIMV